MNPRRLFCIGLIGLGFAAVPQAWGAGRAAAQLGDDARAEGLGGLSAVLESGSLSLNANPATLAGMDGMDAAFTHQAWLADTHQEDLALAVPFSADFGVGAQVGWFAVPAFDGTGGAEASIDGSLLSVDLGLGKRLHSLGGIRFGASLRYLQQSLGGTQFKDLGLNLGAVIPTPYHPLSFAVTGRQIGLWRQADADLPTQVVAGAALDYGALLIAAEAQVPLQDAVPLFRGGIEWRLHPALSLRAGLSGNEAPDQPLAPDLGAGIKLGALGIDLASTSRGILGNTLSATLRLKFGSAKPPTPVATPEPTPQPKPVPTRVPRAKVVPLPEQGGSGEADWDGGSFELDATVQGEVVQLNWADLLKDHPDAMGYEVLISLVPKASMRALNQGRQKEHQWQGEMGMRGMTYYFRVKLYGSTGQVLAVSRIKQVLMP